MSFLTKKHYPFRNPCLRVLLKRVAKDGGVEGLQQVRKDYFLGQKALVEGNIYALTKEEKNQLSWWKLFNEWKNRGEKERDEVTHRQWKVLAGMESMSKKERKNYVGLEKKERSSSTCETAIEAEKEEKWWGRFSYWVAAGFAIVGGLMGSLVPSTINQTNVLIWAASYGLLGMGFTKFMVTITGCFTNARVGWLVTRFPKNEDVTRVLKAIEEKIAEVGNKQAVTALRKN